MNPCIFEMESLYIRHLYVGAAKGTKNVRSNSTVSLEIQFDTLNSIYTLPIILSEFTCTQSLKLTASRRSCSVRVLRYKLGTTLHHEDEVMDS